MEITKKTLQPKEIPIPKTFTVKQTGPQTGEIISTVNNVSNLTFGRSVNHESFMDAVMVSFLEKEYGPMFELADVREYPQQFDKYLAFYGLPAHASSLFFKYDAVASSFGLLKETQSKKDFIERLNKGLELTPGHIKELQELELEIQNLKLEHSDDSGFLDYTINELKQALAKAFVEHGKVTSFSEYLANQPK